jgi:hypothetical protein
MWLVTSQDFIKFWGNFFLPLFGVYWLKIHKGLKLFELFKTLIWKLFQNFLLHLEEFPWEKEGFQNYYFLLLFKLMQVMLAKDGLQITHFIEYFIFTIKLESYFQTLFYKVLSQILKRIIFLNPNLFCIFAKRSFS